MITNTSAVGVGLLGLLGVGYLWAARRARNHWKQPGGELFTGLAFALGLSAWFLGGAIAAELSAGAYAVFPVQEAMLLLLPVIWAAFAARRGGFDLLTRRRAAALVVVLSALSLLYTAARYRLEFSAADGPTVEYLLLFMLPWMVTMALTLTMLVVGVGIVTSQTLQYDHLPAGRAIALSTGVVGPWLGTMLGMSFHDAGAAVVLTLQVTGYAVGLVSLWLALDRYDLFEASGAAGTIGPAEVVDSLEDAVVVVDDEGRVLELNPSASRLFGIDSSDSAGRPAESVVGAGLDELRSAEVLELSTSLGHRTFEPTAATLTGPDGDVTGYSFVLRDVTERRTREQRLEVLNRVLRHNLRNQVGVINGYAQSLNDGAVADGGEDAVDHITRTADDLIDLSEKARTVAELMAEPRVVEGTAASSAVRSAVRTVREQYPGCSFSVEVREDVTVDANPRVIEPVVENLVENAAEHNDADDPKVRVEVATEPDDSLVVTVVDNGPGIPETERDVVESGEVTPLEHGSGLGLWVAKWGVTRLGGALSFDTTEPRGTIATLTIPRRRQPRDAKPTALA